ncbi:MAG: DUF2946 family protein [Lysobacteraceae bacterium]
MAPSKRFDEQVLKAMTRWPDVPAVHGWLRLDRRGGWHLIDRGQPGFDETRDGRGSPITSQPIIDFIERNYTHEADGRWYWQNGPQRVYVDIDGAPLILRAFGSGEQVRFVAQTGDQVVRIDAGWTGPAGDVLLATDQGPAMVHDLDLGALALENQGDTITLVAGGRRIPLQPCDDPPATLGFAARPRPPAAR